MRACFHFCLTVGLSVAVLGCGGDARNKPDSDRAANPEQVAANNGDPSQPRALVETTLALNWFPEAEHGGFYAALVHGYFEDAGLKVKIIPGGPNVPVLQQVAGQQVTFGISNADQILLGRAQEADVVTVMAPLQTSPRCIIVHKKSGITDFKDLKNVTLAMSSTATWASFVRKHVPLEGVKIVPYPGNVAQFLLNDDYAQQAYVFSEPYVAEKKGGDSHCLMVSDLGFNPYTSVLFTHADVIDKNADLVQRMVTASIRGWRKYLVDPVETNKYINQQNTEMDLDILAYGAKSLKPLCIDNQTPAEQLGRMTAARWKSLGDQLVEAEAIKAAANKPAAAFTTRFLKSPAAK